MRVAFIRAQSSLVWARRVVILMRILSYLLVFREPEQPGVMLGKSALNAFCHRVLAEYRHELWERVPVGVSLTALESTIKFAVTQKILVTDVTANFYQETKSAGNCGEGSGVSQGCVSASLLLNTYMDKALDISVAQSLLHLCWQ